MVKKAVILAGGMGTRFLPITKSIPKEMLPVVNKPALQYISEEVEAAGIKSLGIVINDDKEAIKRHFRPSPKLEAFLDKAGKTEFLKAVKDICNIEVEFIIQKEALGSAHAVGCTREFIGKDNFALLNGDDVMYTGAGVSVTKQLCECFNKYKKTVIGVQPVPRELIVKYGVINILRNEGRTYFIDKIVEKPSPAEICSDLASLGRYVMDNCIFDVIKDLKPGKGGELQITDALNILAAGGKAVAYDFEGRRYDLGAKQGYMEANIEYGLRDKEIGETLKAYLKTLKF